MNNDNIFDTKYVDEKTTSGTPSTSKVKEFLKNPLEDERWKSYGTSKPKRIIIKAKISGS